MYSHSRERQQAVSSEVPDNVFEDITQEETRTELLSPKGYDSRGVDTGKIIDVSLDTPPSFAPSYLELCSVREKSTD
jgi:hypothetical protein